LYVKKNLGYGGTGRHVDLRNQCEIVCEFESRYPKKCFNEKVV
jgi:hypothetical protein